MNICEDFGRRETILMISLTFDCNSRDVAMAIHQHCVLIKMGILDSYRGKFSFEDDSFVNILLSEYSDKTSFVQNFVSTLAQSVNTKLHKIKTTNDEEIKDILNSTKTENRLKNKAFLNEILGTNAVATIWITKKRFDVKLEFKALNARQRVKLFKKDAIF